VTFKKENEAFGTSMTLKSGSSLLIFLISHNLITKAHFQKLLKNLFKPKSFGKKGFKILNSENLDHCPDKSGKLREDFWKAQLPFFGSVTFFLHSNFVCDEEI